MTNRDPDVKALTEKLHLKAIISSCINCVHFQEKSETCGKWEQKPPAIVIAQGCDDWQEDLPF